MLTLNRAADVAAAVKVGGREAENMAVTITQLGVVQHPVRQQTRFGPTALFGVTAGLSALLMFTIEPLAAKQLLPDLGGSAAVWNTAMAFFQVALLLGYLAAHLISTYVPSRWRLPFQLLYSSGRSSPSHLHSRPLPL